MGFSDNAQPSLLIRFREVPYSIETGEAEMISVDFVARGGANATVAREPQKTTVEAKGKGKSKAEPNDDTLPEVELLSAEDEELISTLTTKANAIRMLQERVALTKAYLSSVPSCYLNTPVTDASAPLQMPSNAQVSHPILRNISSMLGRLPLLTPPTSTSTNGTNSARTAASSVFSHEAAVQRSDVALVSLLGSMGGTLRSAVAMGRKSAIMEKGKSQSASSKGNNFNGSGGPAWNAYGGEPALPSFGEQGFGDEGLGDEVYDDAGDEELWSDEDGKTGRLGFAELGGGGTGGANLADFEGRDGDDSEMT
jgi:COP9 signalosome complex subunit 6